MSPPGTSLDAVVKSELDGLTEWEGLHMHLVGGAAMVVVGVVGLFQALQRAARGEGWGRERAAEAREQLAWVGGFSMMLLVFGMGLIEPHADRFLASVALVLLPAVGVRMSAAWLRWTVVRDENSRRVVEGRPRVRWVRSPMHVALLWLAGFVASAAVGIATMWVIAVHASPTQGDALGKAAGAALMVGIVALVLGAGVHMVVQAVRRSRYGVLYPTE